MSVKPDTKRHRVQTKGPPTLKMRIGTHLKLFGQGQNDAALHFLVTKGLSAGFPAS